MFNKAEHNRKIKYLRDLGVIPYQDGTFRPKPSNDEKRWKQEAEADYKRITVSKNGSILPNKWSHWKMPFNKINTKDL